MAIPAPTLRTLVLTGSICIGIVGASAGVITIVHLRSAHAVLSSQILNKVSFSVYYPGGSTKDSSAWVLQKQRSSYDSTTGVLTLVAQQSSSRRTVVISEQSTPDAFADVPTQYSKMLNSLNEYKELQTGFGTIALTHPKELNGGQTAVINKGGTLLFAKPSANLDDNEWLRFFESLETIR